MERNRKCPVCGSSEIGQGILTGYANITPVKGRIFKSGSAILADICTECGNILSMRVEKPEKFK